MVHTKNKYKVQNSHNSPQNSQIKNDYILCENSLTKEIVEVRNRYYENIFSENQKMQSLNGKLKRKLRVEA